MKKCNYTSALLLDSSLLVSFCNSIQFTLFKEHFLRFDTLEGFGKIKKLILQNRNGLLLSDKGEIWRIDLSSLFTILNKKKLLQFFESAHTLDIKRELSDILVHDVACNENAVFLVSSQGDVYCWGRDPNHSGILGLGKDIISMNSPTKIPLISGVTQISLSSKHVAAVDSGESNIIIFGTFNGKDFDEKEGPRTIQNLPKAVITDISFGDTFGLLLTEKGELYVTSEHFICQKLHFSLLFKGIASRKDKIYGITADGKYISEWVCKLDSSRKQKRLDTYIRNEGLSLVKMSELIDDYKSGFTIQPYQQVGGTVFFFDQEENSSLSCPDNNSNIKFESSRHKEGRIIMRVLKGIGKKCTKSSFDFTAFESSCNVDTSPFKGSNEKVIEKSNLIKEKFYNQTFEVKKENTRPNWSSIANIVSPSQKRREALDLLGLSNFKSPISNQKQEKQIDSVKRLSKLQHMMAEPHVLREKRLNTENIECKEEEAVNYEKQKHCAYTERSHDHQEDDNVDLKPTETPEPRPEEASPVASNIEAELIQIKNYMYRDIKKPEPIQEESESLFGDRNNTREPQENSSPFRSLKNGKFDQAKNLPLPYPRAERPSGLQEISIIEKDKSELPVDSTFGEHTGEEVELENSKTLSKVMRDIGQNANVMKLTIKQQTAREKEGDEEIIDYEVVRLSKRNTLVQLLQGIQQGEIKDMSAIEKNYDSSFLKDEHSKLKRKKACLFMVEIIRRKALNHMYRCLLDIQRYSIEKNQRRVGKLEKMVNVFRRYWMRRELEQLGEAFNTLKDFNDKQNKQQDELDDFVSQLSRLMRMGKILDNQLSFIYKDFFFQLREYAISHSRKSLKVSSLVNTISRITTRKIYSESLRKLRVFSIRMRPINKFVQLLETKRMSSIINMLRTFFNQLKLKSEIMRIKYPHLGFTFNQKLQNYKRKVVANAFNQIIHVGRERKDRIHQSLLQRTHSVNSLEFLLSKYLYKTKREAFYRLNVIPKNQFKIGEGAQKASLAIILLRIYMRSLKSGLHQIKEHGYLRNDKMKNQQIRKTALKHLAKTLEVKILGYYRNFLHSLKIKTELYASDKHSQSIQMNYKLAILSHKLQLLKNKKKAEAFNLLRGKEAGTKHLQAKGFVMYIKSFLLKKLKHIYFKSAFLALKGPMNVSPPQFRQRGLLIEPGRDNVQLKSPNFNYLEEEKSEGLSKISTEQNDNISGKFTPFLNEEEGDFDELLQLSKQKSQKRLPSLGSKLEQARRKNKALKEHLKAVKIGTFGIEEPEEENRPLGEKNSSSPSRTLSLATNSPLPKSRGYLMNKDEKFWNNSNQIVFTTSNRDSNSIKNDKAPSMIDHVALHDTNSDHFNWTPKAKDDSYPHSNNSPKTKSNNLLRNYGIAFRSNPEEEDGQQKNLTPSKNPIYMRERAQLHNPNESMELFNVAKEDSELNEEYAEPIELEAKGLQHQAQVEPELHLSSLTTSQIGVGNSLLNGTSNFAILSPKEFNGFFSPSPPQSAQKEHVYTKLLPKPKNTGKTLDKPQATKKANNNQYDAQAQRKNKNNAETKENKVTFHLSPSSANPARSISNERKLAPSKPKLTVKKPANNIKMMKAGPSTPSPVAGKKVHKPSKFSKENKSSELALTNKPCSVSDKVLHEPLRIIENRGDLYYNVDNQFLTKHSQASSKKDLKIQIPGSSPKEVFSLGIMTQVEQRLLDEEKYGALYTLYKDRNPEKADTLRSLLKGNASAKLSASKNFSPNGTLTSSML